MKMGKLAEKPEAIMINVPEAFFLLDGKIKGAERREAHFRAHYEAMGKLEMPEGVFYHFISSVPVHEVAFVFVCFKGKVQYKARVVEFLRNQPIDVPGYSHPDPRNWCITTGPVEKSPEDIAQKGFRGFRYCKMIF